MRKAELNKNGRTVIFYTTKRHTVFGKERVTQEPGWWHTYSKRSKALRAIRAWANEGKIMKERST